jgi:hypothetical protein
MERASSCRSCQRARLWKHDGPAGSTEYHSAQLHKQCASTTSFAATGAFCSSIFSAPAMGSASANSNARSRIRRYPSLRALSSLMCKLHALRGVVGPTISTLCTISSLIFTICEYCHIFRFQNRPRGDAALIILLSPFHFVLLGFSHAHRFSGRYWLKPIKQRAHADHKAG